MTEERNEQDWEVLNEAEDEERRKSLEKTEKAVRELLDISEELDRLEAIPDEVWNAAQELDDQEAQESGDAGLAE